MFFYLLFYSKVYYQIQTIFKTLQLTFFKAYFSV